MLNEHSKQENNNNAEKHNHDVKKNTNRSSLMMRQWLCNPFVPSLFAKKDCRAHSCLYTAPIHPS